MMNKVGFIIFLITQAAVVSTDPDVVCPSESVQTSVGEDVILQCHLVPPVDAANMTVEWSYAHLNHIVHLYQDKKDNPAEQNQHFGERASLSHEGLTKGNLSLKLSSVQLSDTGTYRCSFYSENLQISCYVNLTVAAAEESKDNIPEFQASHSVQAGVKVLIGIVVGAIVLVIIIIIVIIVIVVVCKKKRRSRGVEIAM